MEFFERQSPFDRIFAGIAFFFASLIVVGVAIGLVHLGTAVLR